MACYESFVMYRRIHHEIQFYRSESTVRQVYGDLNVG